jgi:hypothetical protein
MKSSEINAKLPSDKTAEAKAVRSKLFDQFDPNGNGYLSLAEADKGIRDVLGLEDVYEAKPAIMRAFHWSEDCWKEHLKIWSRLCDAFRVQTAPSLSRQVL